MRVRSLWGAVCVAATACAAFLVKWDYQQIDSMASIDKLPQGVDDEGTRRTILEAATTGFSEGMGRVDGLEVLQAIVLTQEWLEYSANGEPTRRVLDPEAIVVRYQGKCAVLYGAVQDHCVSVNYATNTCNGWGERSWVRLMDERARARDKAIACDLVR